MLWKERVVNQSQMFSLSLDKNVCRDVNSKQQTTKINFGTKTFVNYLRLSVIPVLYSVDKQE